ncbi:fimbrial protein [Burkholderia sp. LMG 21824]|uniref:fimbrial protein n=1 Tax=Burkholderia sp. LMG 21824 TaxID=3158172 RepID=UPI003C2D1FD1
MPVRQLLRLLTPAVLGSLAILTTDASAAIVSLAGLAPVDSRKGTVLSGRQIHTTEDALCGAVGECILTEIEGARDCNTGASPGQLSQPQPCVPGTLVQLLINGVVQQTGKLAVPINLRIRPLKVVIQLLSDGTTRPADLGHAEFTHPPPVYRLHYRSGITSTINLRFSLKGMTSTCKLKNTSVQLRPVLASDFNAPGAVSGEMHFEIVLESCPSGPTAADYIVYSNPPAPDTSVLPADQGSSASGIAISVVDLNYNPLPQIVPIPFTYTPGVIRIPLKARYVSTSQSIRPGTLKSSLQFLVNYK